LRQLPRFPGLALVATGSFAGILGLVLIASAATELTILRLTILFQQQLAVLDPVLEDLERKKLIAAWASMRSRRDYDEINKRLESYAVARGVERLPGFDAHPAPTPKTPETK